MTETYDPASRTRFEVNRSKTIRHHLICYQDRFYTEDVPPEERHQGPWQSLFRGDVTALRPEIRRALACDGYCTVDCEIWELNGRLGCC